MDKGAHLLEGQLGTGLILSDVKFGSPPPDLTITGVWSLLNHKSCPFFPMMVAGVMLQQSH